LWRKLKQAKTVQAVRKKTSQEEKLQKVSRISSCRWRKERRENNIPDYARWGNNREKLGGGVAPVKPALGVSDTKRAQRRKSGQ